jgi:hypothetical protein
MKLDELQIDYTFDARIMKFFESYGEGLAAGPLLGIPTGEVKRKELTFDGMTVIITSCYSEESFNVAVSCYNKKP